jgi:hypothetical protein
MEKPSDTDPCNQKVLKGTEVHESCRRDTRQGVRTGEAELRKTLQEREIRREAGLRVF